MARKSLKEIEQQMEQLLHRVNVLEMVCQQKLRMLKRLDAINELRHSDVYFSMSHEMYLATEAEYQTLTAATNAF